ncbi:MAG: hypothetical protein EPN48_16095 [Microbacteriaceae bacterium]|nr:MAG: hypothetical protein EPN48_16095 [Microbacteriaceae bacterium]
MQNPLLSGYSATEAYLPSKKAAIGMAVTSEPAAFNENGNYPNASDTVFRAIGAYVAPSDPPPTSSK